jgi:uncharacterized membrane protein YdfJ with MMPL/SSD domain
MRMAVLGTGIMGAAHPPRPSGGSRRRSRRNGRLGPIDVEAAKVLSADSYRQPWELTRERIRMAKSPIDRLASLGEEVLGKASQNPTANKLVQGAMQLKERVDDLSKRVRGLEQMEKRLNQLEKRVAKLERGAKKASGATKKMTAAKEAATAPPEPAAAPEPEP